MKRALHFAFAALCLAGCSAFFNPDNHLGGGDGGLDAGMDGTTDGTTDALVPDGNPPGDGMVDGGRPDGPVLCPVDESRHVRLWGENVGNVVIGGINITPLVSVAATIAPDAPNVSIAWVDDGSAFVRTVDDLDAIADDDGSRATWNVGPAFTAIGGPLDPIQSIAIRRMGAPGDIALLLAGEVNDPDHGAYGALVTDAGDLNGGAVSPRAAGAGPALNPGVITGRPGAAGRFLFRVLPMSGPEYTSLRVETFDDEEFLTGGKGTIPGDPMDGWAVGSDHYLALIEWGAEMYLWTGVGVPIAPPGSVPGTEPYASDISYVGPGVDAADRYVVSAVDLADERARQLIDCEACFDASCELTAPVDCTLVQENVDPSDGTERSVIATDYAPGIGFVQITDDADRLVARFFGPDLEPAVDPDGGVVEVTLFDLDGGSVFALDVDTIRRNEAGVDRTTVVFGFGILSPDGSTSELTMGKLDVAVAVADDCSPVP